MSPDSGIHEKSINTTPQLISEISTKTKKKKREKEHSDGLYNLENFRIQYIQL